MMESAIELSPRLRVVGVTKLFDWRVPYPESRPFPMTSRAATGGFSLPSS
jgi:hypothetical protein